VQIYKYQDIEIPMRKLLLPKISAKPKIADIALNSTQRAK
jgi:hypothetical protein